MNNIGKKSGFTIVETLVAITILMISIAGPLVVASKGLSGAITAKDQMFASFLAQESMEAIKNTRDKSVGTGQEWLSGLTLAGTACTFARRCGASAADTRGVITECDPGTMCQVNLETGGDYGYASGVPTKYYRWFYVHAANSQADCTSEDECGVTVEVDWNEGVTPYSIVLTSEITSTIR